MKKANRNKFVELYQLYSQISKMKYLKKSLGQNFLSDKNIIKKIVGLVDINNKNIIEIGPGNGALTDEILKNNPKSITLVEKDNLLAQGLKKKYSSMQFLKVYNDDILKFDIEKLKIKDQLFLEIYLIIFRLKY